MAKIARIGNMWQRKVLITIFHGMEKATQLPKRPEVKDELTVESLLSAFEEYSSATEARMAKLQNEVSLLRYLVTNGQSMRGLQAKYDRSTPEQREMDA